LVVLGLGVWFAVVVTAFALLWRYKSTPGDPGAIADRWPTQSTIVPASDRPTLVMFAHPKCDCTRASLAELREVMSRFSDKLSARVMLVRPKGSPAGWVSASSRNWALASSIPGVQVSEDLDGVEAARFGAATSGEVVLYGPEGKLRFHGGITGVRGHEGDNQGLQGLMTAIATAPVAIAASKVFGCALEDEIEKGGEP
jgi:hypothetical protein